MYILPKPQKWTMESGVLYLSYEDMITVDSSCGREVTAYALELQKQIYEEMGLELGVSRTDSLCHSPHGGILLCREGQMGEQEYSLTVDEKGICITAATEVGMFYGIQSLRQILRQAGGAVPYMEIHDYPSIPYRGLFYDVTRGRIPTVAYLKQLMDLMAEYKLNQLHLYIEHTFMFAGLSEMWRDDTPLTAEDILELDEYSRRRNIELVPSIATFGHLYKLLRTRDFRHLCEMPERCDDVFRFTDRMKQHTLNVSDEDSMALVKGLIGQYMRLFRSDKFNICGDETFDLGKGRSKALAEQIGTETMYIRFVKELCRFVVEQGRTPMFWGDIISSFPDAVCELPQETICLNWGYYEELNDESIRRFSELGVRQYCCPGVRGWNQLVNEIRASYGNIKRMCNYAAQYHAEGLLNTDWGDYGHINHPDFGRTGILYGAAFSWNREVPDFDEINRQISRLEFRDTSESFVHVIAQISDHQAYQWRNAVWFMEGKEGAPDEEQLAKAETAKTELILLKQKLSALIGRLDTTTRKRVQPYLVAIDGMLLLQDLGLALRRIEDAKTDCTNTDCENTDGAIEDRIKIDGEQLRQLAARWETWFMYYKREWRKVSRESELYRIQNVIHYYADYLRDHSGLE